ncbi:MAG TPA: aromatic-ring-hydroxylating dioxygenase subunit beta [Acidimicrobiales bacterium]|nr:aromatic-ring-hydroxylating dioxygenase subunit beta [Acidimicrobiales bacterium]
MTEVTSRGRMASFVRPGDPDHVDALLFLLAEAEVLDAADFVAWLDLLAPEVRYAVPVRTSRLRSDAARPTTPSYHLEEDRSSLEFRVRRIVDSDASWAYNPHSRTRRFVSNVRVRRTEGADLRVSSYVLLLRSRHDRDGYDIVTGERHDLLGRRSDGDLELRAREVVLDQARLGVAGMPFPI